MKKPPKITIILCAAIISVSALICTSVFCEENASGELLNEYAEFYGKAFESAGGDVLGGIPGFNPEDILRDLNTGRLPFTAKEAFKFAVKLLLGGIYSELRLLVTVLTLSVLSAYLSELKSGFGADSVAVCAFYVCYIIIAGVSASAFYEAAVCAADAVRSIAFFMRVLVPVMITALMTSGAIISASALEPTMLAMAEAAVFIIESIFIPAVMLSAALNIVNGMSDRFKTDRMVKLINNTVKWGLSITLTVFVSFAGLKSIAAAGVDGLTVKLSKFAASNLIPMVGGILSESVETVMNCSVVIKNSVGVLGIICLILIVLRPVLKLAATLILFRITAAAAEPVSDAKIVTCISRLGDAVSALFSMLAAVTVMFVMVVTILINTGSTAVMLGR